MEKPKSFVIYRHTNKENGHHASAIRRCLAGKLKSHHGLRFREIAPESLAA